MKTLTRKFSSGLLITVLLTLGHTLAQEPGAKAAAPSTTISPIEVTITVPPMATFTRNYVPLRVTFENTSAESIRLLQRFQPSSAFFDLTMKDRAGNIVPLPKAIIPAATIEELRRSDGQKYVELKKNDSFGVILDIAKLLPPKLPEDYYVLSLTYHNQYGENCFKGVQTAENETITIYDVPVDDVPGSITEQKALEVATATVAKLKLKPGLTASIRNNAKRFIVTFDDPNAPPAGCPGTGGDFVVRIWINRMTGAVVGVEGSA